MYIDVFLMENLMMDYILLRICSKIVRHKHGRWFHIRMLLGGLFAAGSALLPLFLNLWSGVPGIVYRLSSVLLTVLIAFDYQGVKQLVTISLAFYGVSFMLAGGIAALSFVVNAESEIVNGIFYWRLETNIASIGIALVVTGLVGYSIVMTIRGKQYETCKLIDLGIVFGNEYYKLRAMVDTGNELCEPFSGRRAIIVEHKIVPIAYTDRKYLRRLRYVPYKSIGRDSGILPGIIPDTVEILDVSADSVRSVGAIENAILCFCEQRLSEKDKYNAIISDELLR